MRTAAIPMLIAALLFGCGYKGPLYLPPPDKPAAAPADTQKPAQQAPQSK